MSSTTENSSVAVVLSATAWPMDAMPGMLLQWLGPSPCFVVPQSLEITGPGGVGRVVLRSEGVFSQDLDLPKLLLGQHPPVDGPQFPVAPGLGNLAGDQLPVL